MCASLSKHIEPLDCAGAIFARTLDPSFKLLPSASIVILPVSCHGTACKCVSIAPGALSVAQIDLFESIPRYREDVVLEIESGEGRLAKSAPHWHPGSGCYGLCQKDTRAFTSTV